MRKKIITYALLTVAVLGGSLATSHNIVQAAEEPNISHNELYDADVNSDGLVSLLDCSIIARNYGATITDENRKCDINHDGKIDTDDFELWYEYYSANNDSID